MMQRALDLASQGLGLTSPNPAVGAVLAVGDRILSEGFHRKAGGPHAEIEALRAAPADIPNDTTLYVTLEPCSTQGKTPPCTDAILEAGIRRVVFGASDPTSANASRAKAILEAKGVEVTAGVLGDECQHLNRAWNKWVTTGIPYLFAKYAMTLDGRIRTPPARSREISSPASHDDAMQLRAKVDAILVGAETIRTDNPRLTVRNGREHSQPLRVVLTRSGNLPRDAIIFTDEYKDRTRIFTNTPLLEVLRTLGSENVTSILLEGGGQLTGDAFDQQLIDELVAYLCPTFLAGPTPAIGGIGIPANNLRATLLNPGFQTIQNDLRIQGQLSYPKD